MSRHTRNVLLSAAILLLGLSVPVVPRIVWPIVRPDVYVDHLGRILEPNGDSLILFAWTALPFFILGTLSFLRRGQAMNRPDELRRRTAGVIGALVVALGVGYWVHVPSPHYGMNFGVPAFPFYAAVAMPLGWLLGRSSEPARRPSPEGVSAD